MPTHTLSWGWESGTDTLSGTYAATAAAELNFDETISSASDQARTATLTVANVESVFIVATQDMTLYINGVNEVQTVSITGTPTGGTFPLTYSGQTTSPELPYNATAAQVKTALEALSNIGADDVSCTGGPLPGTAVVVTFRKALGSTNVAQMTTSSANLTGGSSPTASVSTTTAGVAASQTITLEANAAIQWAQDLGSSYGSNPLTANWTTGFTAANDSGSSGNLYIRVLYN